VRAMVFVFFVLFVVASAWERLDFRDLSAAK
jgi:hypothetical protein